MKISITKSTMVAFCMVSSLMAEAAVYELRGYVSNVRSVYSGELGPIDAPADIQAGTIFTGSLSTDGAGVRSSGQSVFGPHVYYSPVMMEGRFGDNYQFSTDGQIQILDGPSALAGQPGPVDYHDKLQFSGTSFYQNLLLEFYYPGIELVWEDYTASAFDSTDLPSVLDMSLFSSRRFSFSTTHVSDGYVPCPSCPGGYEYRVHGEASYSIEITLTDIAEVPLPGAALLFPSALGMFCAGLNRRRRVPRTL